MQCARVQCDCPTSDLGCPDTVAPILPELRGPIDINCGEREGEDDPWCSIGIEGLGFDLEAPCIASECRGDNSDASTVSVDESLFDTPAQTNWNVVFSGIPLYFAGGLAFLILLLTIPRMLAVQSAVSTVRKHKSSGIASTGWAGTGGAHLAHSPP